MILEYKIKKSVAEVFDILSDMQKFTDVHPLVYKVEQVADSKYKVFEKVKMGFLNLDFTYYAIAHKNETEKTISIDAKVHLVNNFGMRFKLTEDGDYTKVLEEVIIKTPLPIKSYMEGLFREQHAILFQNLEKY
jgi:carbon monoxide dehydrogenase subunit G